jgi:hypothetical protein
MTIFEITYKDGQIHKFECVYDFQTETILKYIKLNDDILCVKEIRL